MNTRVLAVHGIGQYLNGDVGDITARLAATYTAALGRDVQAVYYAHLLRDPDAQNAATGRLTDDEAAILLQWALALGVPEETTMGYAAFPVRLVADWIARRIASTDDDAMIRKIARYLTNFARDAAAYLNHPDRRTAVREHLTAVIDTHKPTVIIAHSLGSVVAYETLWAAAQHHHVPLLITVGSPLAMPGAIFDRLQPSPTPNARDGYGTQPPNTDRWINIADPGDIVAIPRPLHRRFHGLDPADDHTSSIGPLAVHGFASYLSNSRLNDCLVGQ